jgi:O-antigen ligase/tetratricopeptide (TPR) repeat protein
LRFLEFLSGTIVYAIIILSPVPYGSIEDYWRFLFISLIALSGIFTAVKFFQNKGSGLVFHKPYTYLIVIIILVLMIALFSPRAHVALRSWVFFAGTGLLPIIIINNFNTKKKLQRLVLVLFLSGIAFSIYELTTMVISATAPGEHLRSTFTSTFYNHNHFAAFLELILPFAISGFLFYKKREQKSLAYILLSALFFATLLLTFSRGGIISFIIALLIVILIYMKNFKIFFPAVLISSIILYLTFSLKSTLGRIFSFEQISLSGNARAMLWKSGIMSALDKPLLGWGPGNFEIAYLKHRHSIDGIVNHAHNDYIQSFVELGVPAALALICFLITILVSGIKEIKKRHNPFYYYLGTSATFAILSIAIHEFVDFCLHIPAISIYFATIFSVFVLSTFAERKSASNDDLIVKSADSGQKPGLIIYVLLSAIILLCSAKIYHNELLFKKASEQYKGGEFELQEKDLERIENSYFTHAKYYNLHCRILNTKGSLENSIITLNQALQKCIYATELDRFNSFYVLDVAEIQKKLGKINEALLTFRTASEIDPENAYLKSIFINELSRANRLNEAKEQSIKFLNKHPEKAVEILSVLKNSPELLKILIDYLSNEKGEMIENILDFLYANNLYGDYLKLFLNVYSKIKFTKQRFYNIAGDYLANTKRYDEAEKILYRGIEVYPQMSESYTKLMNLLFFLKKYEELLKLTERAEKTVDLTDAYYYRALVFSEKGEFLSALKNAKLCTGRNANNNKYRYLLYDIYMKMGMEYEAMQSLGDPDTYTPGDIHLMELRASLFEKWNKNEDAIKEYRRILLFHPGNQFAIKKIIELAEKTQK